MSDYIAETTSEPRIRAWLTREEPGWRIVIETVDEEIEFDPLISTWERTIEEAIAHTEDYWTDRPIWRDDTTGEIVVPKDHQ